MHRCLGFSQYGDLPAISVGYILQLQEGASWIGQASTLARGS